MSDQGHIFSGAGGGGDKTPQAYEAPDSLLSTAMARIVDAVSEGPIKGLKNGSQSIYFDRTPFENADGSTNFKNALIEYRSGTIDQSHVSAQPGVENENAGNPIKLEYGSPWTQALNNRELSAVRIRLSTPQLQSADVKANRVDGTTITYRISVSTDGSAFVDVYRGSMTGKASNKYERSDLVQLPPAQTGWRIRLTRETPNSTSQSLMNDLYIEGWTEIISVKLRYPHTALFAITIAAEQFQNIPTRAYHLQGRLIQVPANYDPVTRAYSGIWDGTFVEAYSDNPAWIYRDMLLHYRYGLGDRLSDSFVDKWALYDIAKWCDQLVPDGYGGQEPRFTCGLYLQSQEDAWKVLQDMSGMFRAMQYWGGGMINPIADKPEDLYKIFTQADVIDGVFEYSGSSRTSRHTVALVTYTDMDDFGAQKVEYVEDVEGIARYGVNQTQVIHIGCRSRGQARRFGKATLLTERYESEMVSFGVGLLGAAVPPGAIIGVMNPARCGQRMGGRVRAATETTVTVDALPFDSPSAGDTLTVILPSGQAQTRIIASVDASTVTVTQAFLLPPIQDASWIVEKSTLKAQLFRVIEVEAVDDESKIIWKITAVQHEPGKYAAIDFDTPFEPRPIYAPLVPPQPIGLDVSHREVVDAGTSQTIVTLSWDQVPGAAYYRLKYRFNDGSWVDVERVVSTSYDIFSAPSGNVEFAVQAVSPNQTASPPSGATGAPIPENTSPPLAVEAAKVDAISQAATDATAKADQALIDAQIIIDAEVQNRLAGDLQSANAVAAEAEVRAEAIANEANIRGQEITNKANQLIGDYTQKFAAERNTTISQIQAEANARGGAIAQAKTDVLTELESVEAASIQRDNQIAAGLGNQFNPVQRWEFAVDAEGWVDQDGVPVVTSNSYILGSTTAANEYVYSPLIAFDAAQNRSVAIKIKKTGNPQWRGEIYSQDWSKSIAWIAEPTFDANGNTVATWNDIPWANPVTQLAVALAHASTTDAYNFYSIDWVAIGSPTPAAGVAYVRSVEKASIDRDQAEASARQALAAQFKMDMGTANASIDTLRKTTSDANSARAQEIANLQAENQTQSGNISTAFNRLATVESVADAAKQTNISQGQLIEGLDSRVHNTETQQSTQAGYIDALNTRAQQIEGVNQSQAEKLIQLDAVNTDIKNDVATRAKKSELTTVETNLNTLKNSAESTARTVEQHGALIAGVDEKATNTANVLRATDATVKQQGGLISSHASDLAHLNVTVFDPDHGVTAMGNAINETKIDVSHLAGTKPNHVPNGSFADGLVGWQRSHADINHVRGYYGDAVQFPASPSVSRYIHRVLDLQLTGNTLGVTVYRESAVGNVWTSAVWLDANDKYIGVAGGGWADEYYYVAKKWVRQWRYFEPPANAAKLDVYCIVNGTDDYTYFQLVKVSEGNNKDPFSDEATTSMVLTQTNAISAAIGGINGSVVTESSITHKLGRLLTKWTMLLNNNGVVSGVVSENDGERPTFSILGSVFRVISATTGLGMEWLDGYLRMWKGSAQLIIGHTFGTSQDLIFYYGPNVGAASASKANASVWFDTTGNAYFGGSLSAGTRKNAAQSTQQSASASVETGAFGTGGNAKVVVCSISAGGFTSQSGNSSGATLNMSARVVLERSYGGGAWTQIGSFDASGQYTKTYVSGDNLTEHRAGCSGSITVTDNQAGTGTFNYRARITSASNVPVTMPNGAYNQSLSVISTEQ